MAAKKEEKEKIIVINFRDKSSNWWVNSKHYCLNDKNEIVFIGGGIEITAETDFLRDFIKRNKKTFKEREISPYINQKEYLEIITFGKYQGRSVQYVFDEDRKYLGWILKNVDLAGKEKLKQEITDILK